MADHFRQNMTEGSSLIMNCDGLTGDVSNILIIFHGYASLYLVNPIYVIHINYMCVKTRCRI